MTKWFLPNLPINEVKTAAGKQHCYLTYLIGLLPNTALMNEAHYWSRAVKWKQKPNQLEMGWLQSQDLDSISLLTNAFIQEHVTFTNTVVISWILTLFLKKHFHIFEYISQCLMYSPRLALCGTRDSVIFILTRFMENLACCAYLMKVHDCHSSFPLKKKDILSCFSATTFLTHLLYSY
jgi:hypothetical protein